MRQHYNYSHLTELKIIASVQEDDDIKTPNEYDFYVCFKVAMITFVHKVIIHVSCPEPSNLGSTGRTRLLYIEGWGTKYPNDCDITCCMGKINPLTITTTIHHTPLCSDRVINLYLHCHFLLLCKD